MKRFIRVVLLLFILSITYSYAITQQIERIGCADGSAVSFQVTVIVFDDNFKPIGAFGICCDGSFWTRNLLLFNSPAQQPAHVELTSVTTNLLELHSNDNVDVRLIDIRTGNYVSDVYHIKTGTPFPINVSTLPTGVYGVVASQNSSPIQLLTFTK